MSMINPWDLKADDARTEDGLPTYILFCEDEVCEKLYFKHFETDKIKINVIGKQKAMMDNVLNAIAYCRENDLLKVVDDQFMLDNDQLQIWCIYDRDLEPDPADHRRGHTEFDEAIDTASRKGIKVAWSNDAFELWVLLHFEALDPAIDYSKRITYYNRLTDILKALPDPNEDLQKALVHASFSYKKDMKHWNNFKDIIRPIMVANTYVAIERAKALEVLHQDKAHHHQKTPCTLVYQLVEELIAAGTKN